MPARGEPLDVNCDAPPYWVVRGCRELGLITPEDVRWLEAGGVLARCGQQVVCPIQYFWNKYHSGNPAGNCSCGRQLPLLEGYLFVLESGTELLFAFGQCGRCHTIYWTKD